MAHPGRKRFLTPFLFLWVMVGFSTGTSTLLGAVEWIAAEGRAAGWSEGVESTVVRAVIVAFVVGSAALAGWLTVVVVRTNLLHVRYGIPVLATAAALGALWLWMSPEIVTAGVPAERSPGSSFTFGPYPSEERMVELEREGYTAVVSLLHPAVVPFEPKLIADGKAAAARAGLDFIHVPMLPWLSGNADAIARLEALARDGTGRYYVHCYLGMDRVGLARRVIERAEPTATTSSEIPPFTLRGGAILERGTVTEIAPGLFLTPHPTDDELVRILSGAHRTVVSLLDPEDPEERNWIERERDALQSLGLELHLLPFPEGGADPESALDIARRVASLPRPLVVHHFLAAGSGRSPIADPFLEAFRSIEAELPTREAGGESIVPGVRQVIVLGPPLLLFTIAAAAFCGRLRAVRRVETPYTRKIFHFVIFTAAGFLYLFGGLAVVNLFGTIVAAAVLYAVVRGDGFAFYEALARPGDAPKRTLFILLPLMTTAVGGLASALMFGRLAYVGYLVGGWGDAVGEPVGAAFGRTRYRVPSLGGVPATRSLEGSAAVFLVSALAAFAGLLVGGTAPPAAMGTALACAVVGTAVEAFSTHGLDNLTLQIAASATAWLLLG